MEEYDQQAVGFISYEWEGAPAGVIDANAGGNALIGIDEAIRFFNRKQARGFSAASYEIPVRTAEGSWIAYVLGVLAIAPVAFATSYAKKAGEKMAERDFAELGFKDVARKSVDALRAFVELVKHTQKTENWTTSGWKDGTVMIGVTNDAGQIFYLPAEYLKWYYELPKTTLKKLVAPVAKGRSMIIASREADDSPFRKVEVTSDDAGLFDADEKEEDEFLLPDLEHGKDVVLEGLITRGNQETNSMGFQYQGHILNCVPAMGNVRRYKSAMFLHCRVHVTIDRHVTSFAHLDRRPTLIVNDVVPLEVEGQQSLF